jgi:hypothetical protein
MIDAEQAIKDEFGKVTKEATDTHAIKVVERWINSPENWDIEKPKGHVGERVVVFTKKITSCAHVCPYFTLDGGPGPVMTCTHPEAPNSGYIISYPECDRDFPALCPLWKE